MATTLGQAITTTLQRCKLNTSTTAYKDQARKYLFMMATDLWPLTRWWFQNLTTTFNTTETFTISAASGTFTVGETVSGGTSLKTATVDHHDTTNSKLYVYDATGTFTASETITGGTSLVTATYASTAYTRVYTPVSSQVLGWRSFYDVDNERELSIVGPERYDELDPTQADTGTVYAVMVGGLDSDTGYPKIELWYTPSTTGIEIRVRYDQALSTAWTSSNDATALQVLGVPLHFENAMIFGAAGLYLEENRQYDAAKVESGNLQRALEAARDANRRMQGDRRFPPKQSARYDGLVIRVGSDIVTA